jgi:endonuclease/exonuclease/phosphatase family metal-dependent hydrolase
VLDAAIVRTNRDGRFPSDHFPVTATLRLTP